MIWKGAAAPRGSRANLRRTPISGTRAVRTLRVFSRHSSLAQPNGSSRPSRSRIASLTLGSMTPKAARSPSISMNQTSRFSRIGLQRLARWRGLGLGQRA